MARLTAVVLEIQRPRFPREDLLRATLAEQSLQRQVNTLTFACLERSKFHLNRLRAASPTQFPCLERAHSHLHPPPNLSPVQ